MVLRYIRCTTSAPYTWRAQGVVLCSLCSFIYFIEKSRYIYRHKSEPTPPTTTKKTMVIKHTTTATHAYTHIGDSSTSRNEQLIKFQLKKAEFCAKNKNEKKKKIWRIHSRLQASPVCERIVEMFTSIRRSRHRRHSGSVALTRLTSWYFLRKSPLRCVGHSWRNQIDSSVACNKSKPHASQRTALTTLPFDINAHDCSTYD